MNEHAYSSGGEGIFPNINNGPLPVVKENLMKQKNKSRSTNRSSVIYKHRQ